MASPPRLSDAEWKVMHALWRRHPASARDVLDEVGRETGWAYTTVKTLLARMVAKGAVRASRRGNASRYEPAVSPAAARRSAVRALIDRAFQGAVAPLLHHLVEEERLSAADRAELKRRIRAVEKEVPRRGASG